MTRNVLKLGVLLISGVFFFISCSDDNVNATSNLLPEEVQSVILVDDLTSDINNVIDDDAFLIAGKEEVSNKSVVDDCVVRTVEIDDANGTKTVTLDFGDGCTGKRGRELKGKIVIEYTEAANEFSKEITFIDFSVDGHQISGTKSVNKIQENASGNKEATHVVNIVTTLSTGEVLTLEGTRVREKIVGSDTEERGDDVYLISGNWRFVNKDGVEVIVTIVDELRREYACKYIVSGLKEISKDGVKSTLDFGDGTCDNKATLTDENGNSSEITLRRR